MKNKGYIISGVGHVVLILWVLFGGWFWQSHENPAVSVANVSLITPNQFQALTASSSAPPATPKSSLSEPKALAPSASPKPRTAPAQKPEPKPEPAPKPLPTPPKPEPKPEAKPAAPDAPPVPDKAPAPPPTPPAPKVAKKAETKKIDRVAPTPAPKTDAKEAPKKQQAVEKKADAPPQKPQKPKEEAAPKEAASRIATEDNTAKEDAAPVNHAPAASPRPENRPRPRATPEKAPEKTPEKKPEKPAEKPKAPEKTAQKAPEKKPDKKAAKKPEKKVEDSVDAAVAAALASGAKGAQGETKGTQGNGTAAEGPPLTSAEKEGLTLAVQKCWYVDVGSAAADVTVVVGFSLNADGTVQSGSVHEVSASQGSPDAQRAAYDAARRAVFVCGADGFQLPAAKYDQWKQVEITFNPAQMRSR